jgi:hypothetical protein
VNADIAKIIMTADKVMGSTTAMSESVVMARSLVWMYDKGVLSVDRRTVHMTEEAFDTIPWQLPFFSEEPHSEMYTRKFVMLDDVKVFCLVPREDGNDVTAV